MISGPSLYDNHYKKHIVKTKSARLKAKFCSYSLYLYMFMKTAETGYQFSKAQKGLTHRLCSVVVSSNLKPLRPFCRTKRVPRKESCVLFVFSSCDCESKSSLYSPKELSVMDVAINRKWKIWEIEYGSDASFLFSNE